jgi:hypothetical protein
LARIAIVPPMAPATMTIVLIKTRFRFADA